MIFKMEVIEAEPGEELVFKNPFPEGETLIAASQEALGSKKTAFVLHGSEAVGFKPAPGFVLYGKY